MKFLDHAKNDTDLTCCVGYDVLSQVFHWLSRQKSLHKHFQLAKFAGGSHTDVYNGNRSSDSTIEIKAATKVLDSDLAVCGVVCIIEYDLTAAAIHISGWHADLCYVRKDNDIDVPISDPDMFKHIRRFLDDVVSAILIGHSKMKEG